MSRYEMMPGRGTSDRYGDMVPLRSVMDRLFESAFAPALLAGRGEGGFGGFGIDVEEDDDAYYVSCQLPGVNPDDVELNVHENVISISGEMRREAREGRRQVMRESQHGRFERHVSLATPVDAQKTEATFKDGVLEITLPKTEASKPRKIEISTAGGSSTASESSRSAQSARSSSGDGQQMDASWQDRQSRGENQSASRSTTSHSEQQSRQQEEARTR